MRLTVSRRTWMAVAGLICALTVTLALPSLSWAQAPAADSAAPATAPAPAADPAPAPAPVPAPAPINAGDTAFMLLSAALVMLMTPGLGLFYGGLTRQKNVLATFKKSFIALAVISLQWFVIGYSLSFSKSVGGLGLIGGLEWCFLNGVPYDATHPFYAPTFPHQLHMVYQLMFAIITPALISGACVERIKFSSYLLFIVLWTTLVYDPLAHWVWADGGWIKFKLQSLDFAGGLVVHVISGFAALCAALVVGRRRGFGEKEMPPHNLMITAIGTALLWFGWFGFNAGSASAANGTAVAAFVNTQFATGAAVFCWAMVEWIHRGKPTVLGACTGAVAGLVAITPAAGFVSPLGAILIGLGVSPICYSAILLKNKLRYDDSLDAFGVHGVGGAFGAVCVGLLAIAALAKTPDAKDLPGLFYGGGATLLISQITSVVVAALYSFVVSFVLLKVIALTMGLRVSDEDEEVGLDISLHSERGYIMEHDQGLLVHTKEATAGKPAMAINGLPADVAPVHGS